MLIFTALQHALNMTLRNISSLVALATTMSMAHASDRAISTSLSGFVENIGQFQNQFSERNSDVLFLAQSGDVQIQLRSNGFSYQIASTPILPSSQDLRTKPVTSVKINRIDFDFPARIDKSDVLKIDERSFYINYIYESEFYNVPAYATIIYRNVFPNIDIKFSIDSESNFKYSYIIHSGGNINLIKLSIKSSVMPYLKNNSLIFNFNNFLFEETIPASWIESASGVELALTDVHYDLDFSTSIPALSFNYNDNPPARMSENKLVIDPTPTVIWGTYYGGPSHELIGQMSVNPTGVCIGGQTASTSLIATAGAFQTVLAGNYDAYVTKFSTSGAILWATYFGGSADDRGWGVDQDVSGNIYLGGITSSTGLATSGSYQVSMSGTSDAFLIKLNPYGVRQWSTYYGGPTSQDRIWSVSVDAAQDIYVGGDTKSYSGIATAGSHQSTMGGDDDAFLAKFSPSGSRIWATYYGGSQGEEGASIATDGTHVFLTGTFTKSTNNIATAGSHQPTKSGLYDTYLVKFNSAGVRLWGTYYGGTSNYDYGSAITVGCNGRIWLVGNTASANGIATAGSHQSTYGGGSSDGFIACFNSSGVRSYGSYYGGNSSDGLTGVARSGADLLYFVGSTSSTNGIATSGSLNPYFLGGGDGLITRFTVGGVQLWGTYYGGLSSDGCSSVGLMSGNLFVAGTSGSNLGIATSGSYQTYMAGNEDSFVALFDGPVALDCKHKEPFYDEHDFMNPMQPRIRQTNEANTSILHYEYLSNSLIIDSNELPNNSILSIQDISGRLLFYAPIGTSTRISMPTLMDETQVLIVRVITSEDAYTIKIIH